MNRKIHKIVLIALIALIIPAIAMAHAVVILEGKIKGGSTVLLNTTGPRDSSDPLAALEHDFVFTTSNGDFFVLINISRYVKLENLGKNVRITGKKRTNGIWVDRIDVKTDDGYKLVYSWEAEHAGFKTSKHNRSLTYPEGYDPEVGNYQ